MVDALFSMQSELTNGVEEFLLKAIMAFGIWRLESRHQEVFCINSTNIYIPRIGK